MFRIFLPPPFFCHGHKSGITSARLPNDLLHAKRGKSNCRSAAAERIPLLSGPSHSHGRRARPLPLPGFSPHSNKSGRRRQRRHTLPRTATPITYHIQDPKKVEIQIEAEKGRKFSKQDSINNVEPEIDAADVGAAEAAVQLLLLVHGEGPLAKVSLAHLQEGDLDAQEGQGDPQKVRIHLITWPSSGFGINFNISVLIFNCISSPNSVGITNQTKRRMTDKCPTERCTG